MGTHPQPREISANGTGELLRKLTLLLNTEQSDLLKDHIAKLASAWSGALSAN